MSRQMQDGKPWTIAPETGDLITTTVGVDCKPTAVSVADLRGAGVSAALTVALIAALGWWLLARWMRRR